MFHSLINLGKFVTIMCEWDTVTFLIYMVSDTLQRGKILISGWLFWILSFLFFSPLSSRVFHCSILLDDCHDWFTTMLSGITSLCANYQNCFVRIQGVFRVTVLIGIIIWVESVEIAPYLCLFFFDLLLMLFPLCLISGKKDRDSSWHCDGQ